MNARNKPGLSRQSRPGFFFGTARGSHIRLLDYDYPSLTCSGRECGARMARSLCFFSVQHQRPCKNAIARHYAADEYIAGRKSQDAGGYFAISNRWSWIDCPLTAVPMLDQQASGPGIRSTKAPTTHRPHVVACDRTYTT